MDSTKAHCTLYACVKSSNKKENYKKQFKGIIVIAGTLETALELCLHAERAGTSATSLEEEQQELWLLGNLSYHCVLGKTACEASIAALPTAWPPVIVTFSLFFLTNPTDFLLL